MKQATQKKYQDHWSWQIDRRLREATFILLCSLAIYLLMSLITYHEGDPAWSHTATSDVVHNAAGRAGAFLSDILLSLFGYFAYGFPPVLLGLGFFLYKQDPAQPGSTSRYLVVLRVVGLVIALLSGCSLLDLGWGNAELPLPMHAGGVLGSAIVMVLKNYVSAQGAALLLFAWFLIGVHLLTGFSWMSVLEKVGSLFLAGVKRARVWLWSRAKTVRQKWQQQPLPHLSLPVLWKPKDSEDPIPETKSVEDIADVFASEPMMPADIADEFPTITPKPVSKSVIKRAIQIKKLQDDDVLDEVDDDSDPLQYKSSPAKGKTTHHQPSLSLLEISEKATGKGYSKAQLQSLSRLVETRLLEFGVDVKVVGVWPGPVITRFELDLAAGIKVSKISGLAKDLARSLSVTSVRVVEVIPGKSYVGLEIPNAHREMVRLKTVLEDSQYQQAKSPLSLGLGKDISGRPMIVDLAKMPHLLVAGTTGSGKSVGLNAMLLSILYKSHPDDVRLIMIDPKMLELAVYDRIPHLLTPVVTDMKDAANALRWCVGEMERRYQLMAAMGVRNVAGYNQRIAKSLEQGEPLMDPFWDPQAGGQPEALEKLPYIVVVVDEFADMMMVVGKKVEELIARIAQKARAAGIHLILATQRPSVDVITGLIKANIPTRIAFQVSSRIDSRTILDQSGAEQLLGHGDMLYLPPGTGIPHRIHGAFVSDDEVHKVTAALRKSGQPTYIESIVEASSNPLMSEFEGEADALYDQAVTIVLESKRASISLVQRRLKIGYNRAARLVEQMEAAGLVSALQSNGLREVLVPSGKK